MRPWILASLLPALLFARPARAQTLAGVWVGTLGPAKVSVCFDPGGKAAYYYAKHGVDIPLRNKGAAAWDEEGERGKVTGRWTLQVGPKGELEGQWRSPDGQRVLPIALAAAKEAGGSSFCQSRAYKALRDETSGAAGKALPDLQLETVSLLGPALKGLQVVGDAHEHAPVRMVLGALNNKLAREYEGCMENAGRGPAHFEVDVDWVFTSPHFLVLTVHKRYFCGGAHPDSNFDPLILERASGKEVDMSTWLTVSPDELGRENWKPTGKRCADVRVDGEFFAVWPTLEGMALRPLFAQVFSGCARDWVLPYSRLRDKLSPAGKRAVAEITHAR